MKSVVKPQQSDEEKQLIEFAFIEKRLSLRSQVLRETNMVVDYQENQTESCPQVNSQMRFKWKTQVFNLEELHKCVTGQGLAQRLEADEVTKFITQKISLGWARLSFYPISLKNGDALVFSPAPTSHRQKQNVTPRSLTFVILERFNTYSFIPHPDFRCGSSLSVWSHLSG